MSLKSAESMSTSELLVAIESMPVDQRSVVASIVELLNKVPHDVSARGIDDLAHHHELEARWID